MNKPGNLQKRNFKMLSDGVVTKHENFILENINNDHCLRMVVFQGEYKWHYHKTMDEVFIVLEGELKIEIKDNQTLLLTQGDFIKIPAKTIHRTSAAVKTVNLLFEKNIDDTVFVDDK